ERARIQTREWKQVIGILVPELDARRVALEQALELEPILDPGPQLDVDLAAGNPEILVDHVEPRRAGAVGERQRLEPRSQRVRKRAKPTPLPVHSRCHEALRFDARTRPMLVCATS